MVDGVDESQIFVGADAVLGHHAAHRRAVALIVFLLDAMGLVARHAEELRDIVADAGIDLLPQVDLARVQRVVEVEHPGVDMAEAGLFFVLVGCRHGDPQGSAKRRVLPAPPPKSTTAKPVAASPRVPQSPCSVNSNLMSRVQSVVGPPQFTGLAGSWA